MITLFNRIIKWFEPSQQTDVERFIQARNPQHPGDIDRLLYEYNYRQHGGWL